MTPPKPPVGSRPKLFDPVVDHYATSGRGDYAMGLQTYRYLRLSMVIVMVALGASVLLVRRHQTHFAQSISAYYYSPARSVLVGALVATGVALTVIKGRTTAEDWLFSIAGVFAPVIAFVPTTSMGSSGLSSEALVAARNNLAALLVAGWVSWVVVAMIAAAAKDDVAQNATTNAWGKWVSVAGMLVLLVTATGAFWWWPSLPEYAHGWSAVAFFAALGSAALANGLGHRIGTGTRSRHSRWYLTVGAAMLLVGIGYVGTALTDHQWSHEVLEVEAVEIVLFTIFWIIQSVERWNWTVAPPATPPTQTASSFPTGLQ